MTISMHPPGPLYLRIILVGVLSMIASGLLYIYVFDVRPSKTNFVLPWMLTCILSIPYIYKQGYIAGRQASEHKKKGA
jgi:hypothetical protein